MNPQEHEKRHLPKGIELEKRRYIGFARQPVSEEHRVFATTPPARSGYHPIRRPWFDNGEK